MKPHASKPAMAVAAALSLMTLACSPARAEVSAEEAAKLKSTLTPLGAELASNKDGSIPRWEGGYTKAPAGYKSGQLRADPFPGEKPLFSITAANASKYADKLSEVTLALFRKYPDYRVDVYPTHRTAAAPQWVYDNTFRNATRAKTTHEGNAVTGAYGGIPFPIPSNGSEVLWNQRLAWSGEEVYFPISTWVQTSDGKRVLATKADEWTTNPYYQKGGSIESLASAENFYTKTKLVTLEPASKSGEAILAWQALESEKISVWQYLVGQRRVRRSPSIAYDTPNFVTSGIGLFDEAFLLYGPLDRHDVKLIGKKEMIVPYNNNRAALAKSEDLVTPKFLNPDLVRWELHRVWVVEATLKPGKRHVVPKRRYYVDEDSWNILLSDGWDAKGQVWRGGYALTLAAPDIPAVVGNVVNWGGYNVQTGEYYISCATNDSRLQYQVIPRSPDAFYSPEGLASQGSR